RRGRERAVAGALPVRRACARMGHPSCRALTRIVFAFRGKSKGTTPRAGPDARGLWYRAEVAEALYQPFPIPGTARGHVWHHVPATRRPRHFHAEPELNLIAAGHAAFGFGEATISVSAGDLLWWPPGQDHVLLDATPDLDLYVIGVTPAFSEHVLAGRVAGAAGGAARVRLDPTTLTRLRSSCAVQIAGGDTAAVERHV